MNLPPLPLPRRGSLWTQRGDRAAFLSANNNPSPPGAESLSAIAGVPGSRMERFLTGRAVGPGDPRGPRGSPHLLAGEAPDANGDGAAESAGWSRDFHLRPSLSVDQYS